MPIQKMLFSIAILLASTATLFAQSVPSFHKAQLIDSVFVHEYVINVPYTENVEKTYTVKVPYTESIKDKDGKAKLVTKTKSVIRTRMVPITKLRSEVRSAELPLGRLVFTRINGDAIDADTLAEELGEEKVIIQLGAGEELGELYQSVLKPSTIVFRRKGIDEK